MNNAFYNKTMENERDRVNVQFCMNEKDFNKHFSSPLFANQLMIIKENGLTLRKTHKKEVKLKNNLYRSSSIGII